nr:putative ring-type e3 ubiquitin transferase c3h69 [Quercus suber]
MLGSMVMNPVRLDSKICTYYHKGLCAYGSRYRYEHVKASRAHSSASSSSTNAHQSLVSDMVPPSSTRSVLGGVTPVPGSPMEIGVVGLGFEEGFAFVLV